MTQEEHGAFGSFWSRDGANRVQDEVDDSERENSDNEANNGIENCVFRVGDFFAVTTGHDITETAPDQHNDGNNTDDIEDGICDPSKDAVDAD